MRFSVITISFNQANFLNQCIQSVLNQQSHEFEIEYIIVDPGSTDGSRELAYAYGDQIIRVFETDSGPADGLNKGFSKATGDILCYLNSDDYLLPNSFSRVKKYFSANPHDVIYGHAHIVNENNIHIRNVYSDEFNIEAAAYGACTLIQPSAFFRRTAFLSTNGFNVNNRSNWDGELFIDMYLSGSTFKRVNEFLSAYRIHNQSITGSGKLRRLHEEYRMKMFEIIKGRKFTQNDKRIQKYHQIKRKILNPRDTIERLLHGPVFRSAK